MNRIPSVHPACLISVGSQFAADFDLCMEDPSTNGQPKGWTIIISGEKQWVVTLLRLYALHRFKAANAELLKAWIVTDPDNPKRQLVDEAFLRTTARAPITVTGPLMSQHNFEAGTFMPILLEETAANGSGQLRKFSRRSRSREKGMGYRLKKPKRGS